MVAGRILSPEELELQLVKARTERARMNARAEWWWTMLAHGRIDLGAPGSDGYTMR